MNKLKLNTQKLIALIMMVVFVALFVFGLVGLLSRNSKKATLMLDTMRLNAILVNAGSGAADAMVELAKEESQRASQAAGLTMAERRVALEKAEVEARARVSDMSVDYSKVNLEPLRNASYKLEDIQRKYYELYNKESSVYIDAQKKLLNKTVETSESEDTANSTVKIDMSGFVPSAELKQIELNVDTAYRVLGNNLKSIYPQLDAYTVDTLKQTLLDINYLPDNSFKARYDRLSSFNKGHFEFFAVLMRNAGSMILWGFMLLLLALVVWFYQPVVKAMGVPRLIITLFFILLCFSSVALNLNFKELLSNSLVRMGMNSILVLAMVPGIQCGISLNLGLPLGIIGGLIGSLMCIEFGFTGWGGLAFSIAVAIVISTILGYLYALLLNKLKGNEMSVTTYVGFSIISLMCIAWLVLPFKSPVMRWPMGNGLRTTINMIASFRYILNEFLAFEIFGVMIPTGLLLFMAIMCLLVWLFSRTKTGIAMQAVGNNPRFAEATGINVDKMRIIGTMLSTILGGIGIIVYSQSYGFMQLYTAPQQMGFIAASAILIGGASTSRAKISHVIIGTFLFQGVLTLGMPVANELVPQSTISETMRILISNGIILYALTKSGGKSNG